MKRRLRRLWVRFRHLWVLDLILLALGLGVMGGIALDRQVLIAVVPPDTVPTDAIPSFRLMAEAWNTIQKAYSAFPMVRPCCWPPRNG